ncbi:MAG TPA: DEAD/DEAH box helicase [Candidatus Saccharimonadales bacterium]|nr:DEAD/DEAH box helicase [Candidatus Saccharimonadales bacterium]
MSFESLGLAPELLRAVADQGYTEPTPVQAQAIPLVLAGRDVLAGAQTGTGKTAAFVLPILQILNATRPQPRQLPFGNGRPRGATGLPIRCLVLTPTRELALQIEESVRTYGARNPIRSTTIYGGVGFDPQVRALRSGPEIVVATPGRLLDHVGQRTIDLGSVEILVLDEADRMLDMGFIRDIRRILAILPPRRQNLLFSATFSDEIRALASGLLQNHAEVQIARRNAVIELVRQVAMPVDRERKRELLSHLIRSGRIEQALVFTRTKHGANRLVEQLERDGVVAAAIHGNKSQGQRVRALDDFKSGRVPILVATEVASRGLDIDGLPHVVNFELPMVPEDYVHRIGRTGRAGMEGDAVSLVCVDEIGLLRDIEGLLRKAVPQEVVPGFEPDRSIRPEAIRLRSAGSVPMGRGGVGRPAAPIRSGRPSPGGFAPARRPGDRDARPASAPMAASNGRAGPDWRSNDARTATNGPAGSRDGRPSLEGRPSVGGRPASGGRSGPNERPAAIARPAYDGRPGSARPGNRDGRPPMGPRHANAGVHPTAGASIGNRPPPPQNRGSRPHRSAPSGRSGGHSRPPMGGRPETIALPGERLARANNTPG